MNKAESNKSVLLIGGEPGQREDCRGDLVRYGYQVDVAATGQEGVGKVLAADWGVVLVDVALPDMSGIEVLDFARKNSPDTSCIMVAAGATVELAVQAMKLGAYDFIARPFTNERLLVAVAKGLDRHRLRQETRRMQHRESQARRQIEERAILENLDRVQGLSSRRVAHELRAPLTAIRSFLTLILQGYVTPQQAHHMQERAAERADELLALIDDILNLAHLKDASYPSAREAVSVEAALKDILALHTPEAEAKGLKVTCEARPCPSISADPAHIKQLWTNLVSNAIKYTPKGGRVTIRLFPEGGLIVGEVRDTGIGIAPEDLPHLFEEFYRTEQAKAFAHQGTGLGLSIVKQIVGHYGGDVYCTSELGKGTLFTFQLPVSRTG